FGGYFHKTGTLPADMSAVTLSRDTPHAASVRGKPETGMQVPVATRQETEHDHRSYRSPPGSHRGLGHHPGSLPEPVPHLPESARRISGALGARGQPVHGHQLPGLPRDRTGPGALVRRRDQLADEAGDGTLDAAKRRPGA